MLLTIIISLLVFILLAVSIIFFPSFKIGKIKIGTYWIVTIIGAILLLLLKCVPLDIVLNNLTSNTTINPIKILVLFISMTFISIVLDELGLFKWASVKAVEYAKDKQLSIFLHMYFLIALLTIFTSNDIIILTITPFICFFCKNAKINPIPYLIGEFAAANTYSMMFVIGNPTNIYLATSQGIGFLEYVKVMFLPTLVSGIVELLLILLIFRKSLKQPFEKSHEDYKLDNKAEIIVASIHLLICLVFLVISNYINIEMWMVSLGTSISLLISLIIFKIIRKEDHTITKSVKRLPFELIPFVLGMFVIIIALDYQEVVKTVGQLLSNNYAIFTDGVSSFLMANIINNIPMSMLYSELISFEPTTEIVKATYASIIGSNIGAFLTPIGALAGIMFTNLTERYDTKLNFKTFVKYGIMISIPVLFVSLLTLEIVL